MLLRSSAMLGEKPVDGAAAVMADVHWCSGTAKMGAS
jgi:hypothetical protein